MSVTRPALANEVAEIQTRIVIEDLMCRGHTKHQIYAVMARHELNPSKAHIDRCMAEITEEWREESEPMREEQRKRHRRMAEQLYRTAFADRKYNTCVQVLRLMTELDGTQAPARVSVSVPHAKGGADPEFEDKSQAELEYFATTGRWPVSVGVH